MARYRQRQWPRDRLDPGRSTGLLVVGMGGPDGPEAVEPYIQSDLAAAAEALEAAGDSQPASLLRAELFRQQGLAAEAAREFESAGQMGDAAEMRTSGADFAVKIYQFGFQAKRETAVEQWPVHPEG